MATTKPDLEKIIKNYKRAIVGGDVHATLTLFEIYVQNRMDAEVAALSYATYALAGHFMSQNDLEKGIALFKYATALFEYINKLFFNLFNNYALSHLQKDNPKFLKLRDNMYKLAEQYQVMAEVNTDPVIKFQFYDKAIELYDRVRKLGSVDAIYKLAQCYENSSIPQYDTARELYEQASRRDHIGALYRLSEIYSENIQYISSISCIALANKLYESAQFYQNLQGLENKEHVKKLYELAARFGHVEAREQLFNPNLENKLSLSLANAKQESPLSSIDSMTEKRKYANSKPVYTDKVSQEKENWQPNATTALNRLGVFPNANKSNYTIPSIPAGIAICQRGY